MANIQLINLGTGPGTGNGENLRSGGAKINASLTALNNDLVEAQTDIQELQTTVTNHEGQILQLTGDVDGKVDKGSLRINRVIFTESGTYTPTDGISYVDVEALGGGGGGGQTAAASGVANVGGGGGAGGYCKKLFTAAEIGTSVAVTIGNGGGSNTSGGSTTFLTLTANGGSNGTQGVAATQGAAGGGGGGGATGGDINVRGEEGVIGWWPAAGVGISGMGASSNYGRGGQARAINSGLSLAGNSASGYGAGGGGAAVSNNTTTTSGGLGSPGIVIITEYILS